ncbi:MAG TPA: cell division protein FtsA [Dehalococcoidia bacterium]|nr:cell division protein FtsA [Dehalococcoidia bacterium]
MTKRIISAIDVGTTKICTNVANLDSGGGIQVLGVGIVPSHGLHKGMVVNVDEAKESIAESVRRAEQASGLRVESAYVGVTGRHISSLNSHGVVAIPRNDRLVRPEDLKRVLSSAQHINMPDDRNILHAIPRHYALDNQERVKNPVGMHGFRLDVETHIITAAIASIQNLVKCIRSVGVEIEDLILEPLASGEAVLTPEEKELGIILADIGGGTTDIAVFKDGSIYHTAIIPVAGYQVTSDISIGLGLPFEIAEAMKKKYGNVYPDMLTKSGETTLSVEDGHSVSCHDLCNIIKVRMEELLRLILLEMPDSNYASLAPAGLVLTGGSSKLSGLEALARSAIRTSTRIGEPMGVYGITDILHDPAHSTGVGLLLWGTRNQGKPAWETRKKSGAFGNFVNLIKKFFGV